MKFIESFSDREPIESQVKMWEDYLGENYKRFYNTEFGKRVAVDDKSYFLKDKSILTNDRPILKEKNIFKSNKNVMKIDRTKKNGGMYF